VIRVNAWSAKFSLELRYKCVHVRRLGFVECCTNVLLICSEEQVCVVLETVAGVLETAGLEECGVPAISVCQHISTSQPLREQLAVEVLGAEDPCVVAGLDPGVFNLYWVQVC
jgi:hypothetical protein